MGKRMGKLMSYLQQLNYRIKLIILQLKGHYSTLCGSLSYHIRVMIAPYKGPSLYYHIKVIKVLCWGRYRTLLES